MFLKAINSAFMKGEKPRGGGSGRTATVHFSSCHYGKEAEFVPLHSCKHTGSKSMPHMSLTGAFLTRTSCEDRLLITLLS